MSLHNKILCKSDTLYRIQYIILYQSQVISNPASKSIPFISSQYSVAWTQIVKNVVSLMPGKLRFVCDLESALLFILAGARV